MLHEKHHLGALLPLPSCTHTLFISTGHTTQNSEEDSECLQGKVSKHYVFQSISAQLQQTWNSVSPHGKEKPYCH